MDPIKVGMCPIKEMDIRGRQGTVVSNEVWAIDVDHVVTRGLTMRGCHVSSPQFEKINCQFDHENIPPRKAVSLQDKRYALPLHLQEITYCNACQFTKHATVFLQYDLLTVDSVLPAELTEHHMVVPVAEC